MPINPSLLISAAMLQDPFVDLATGTAMANGVITMYQDSNRTVLKNWYYQTGVPGAYTYAALPNPLTLSAAGTIVDVNGNDTIPFYYPYSETDNVTPQPYYVTVVDSNGQSQFTRANFPFIGIAKPTPVESPTFKNYIVNNTFWRNLGSVSLTNVTSTQTLPQECLAPSQHGGFSMPDFQFYKSTTGAVETVTFNTFPAGTPVIGAGTQPDIQPEYYLNHQCTAKQTAETYKYYQFPVSLHLATLNTVEGTISIWAQSTGGSVNNTVTLSFLQFLGTAGGSSNTITIGSFTATTTWTQYTFSFITPSTLGLSLPSTLGDDALYLQIGLQAGHTLNINFTKPSLYFSEVAPTNDFATYDQTDSIINSPRTGDYRHSMNAFLPGWVPANDGTIGSAGSGATTRANVDTWPLYNLLYSGVADHWATVSGRTGNARNDFSNNLPMTLTKNLGRVLQGLDPVFVTPSTFTATLTPANFTVDAGNTAKINVTNTFTAGTPVQVSNSGGALPVGYVPPYSAAQADDPYLQASTTYYVSSANLTTAKIELAPTLADAIAGTNSIKFSSAGTGTHSIVNTVNTLTLATSQSPVLKTGVAVVFSNTGGALPSGLSANTVYYITTTALTATTITVSDNLTDALNGYFIPILSAGSGTNTVSNALGAYSGAGYTTQVARHSHIIPSTGDSNALIADISGTTAGSGANLGKIPQGTTTFIDGVERVSLIQPSANVNVFLKL